MPSKGPKIARRRRTGKRARPLLSEPNGAAIAVARRIYVIQRLRSRVPGQKRHSTIIEAVMKRFGVSESTAERDYADACKQLSNDFERWRPMAGMDIMEDLLDARNVAARGDKATKQGPDQKARIAADRALMKLFGLEKLEIEHVDVDSAIRAALANMRPDFSRLTREERAQLRPVLHLLAKIAPASSLSAIGGQGGDDPEPPEAPPPAEPEPTA